MLLPLAFPVLAALTSRSAACPEPTPSLDLRIVDSEFARAIVEGHRTPDRGHPACP